MNLLFAQATLKYWELIDLVNINSSIAEWLKRLINSRFLHGVGRSRDNFFNEGRHTQAPDTSLMEELGGSSGSII